MGGQTVRALDGVSLQFRRGDYYAVMGPSGSGKSTLLNLLGCLDRPTQGQYLLGGTDVSTLDDDQLSGVRSSRLGFVFQSFNLIPQLTVVENIEIPLIYQGVSPRQARARAHEMAAMVGLSERLEHRPTQLSGGQQQRVAIARALTNDPLVILADEPTGNLDSVTQHEIMDMFDVMSRDGKTIILVTHEDDVAHRARHVLHLADGKIVRIETSEDRRRRMGLAGGTA
ncbi:MAG: ABC transporter ATP-binding protein [Phycisphaerae bacterium]|nr:ABC transporter ATP-binding protein [Phycisphaerae bacterium]